MRKREILSVLVLSAVVSCAFAAQNNTDYDTTTQLNDLVVTANRIEESQFAAPANMTVITAQDIEDRHFDNLSDAIKDVPGIMIHTYGGSGANYSANRMYINGSDKIVILVDGSRLQPGSLGSSYNLAELPDLANIERIEVLKGSSSTLYGADAVGGVINIITKKGKEDATRTRISQEWGSFGYNKTTLAHEGSKDGIFWNISGVLDKADNYKDADSFTVIRKVDAKAFNLGLGYELGKNSYVKASYNRYLNDYERPNNGLNLVADLKKGNKSNYRYDVQWQKYFGNATNHLSLFRNSRYQDDGGRITYAKTKGLNEQITYNMDKATLVAGYEYQKDVDATNESGPYLQSNALFAQAMIYATPEITITPGIRRTSTHSFGSDTTKSISISHNNGTTNFYASYNEFFVPPTYNQLYSPWGSKDLKPATGDTLTFGVKHRMNHGLVGEFNIYKTKAENMVIWDNSSYKYANLGDATINGWSLGVTKEVSNKLSLSATYTGVYIPAKSKDENPNIDGYIPRASIDLSATYSVNRFNGNITARGIWDRPGRHSQEAVALQSNSSYWLVDATFNYEANENTNIFLKLNNITDVLYTDNVYQATPGSDQWYPGEGRNYQMGVTYKF